MTPFARTCSMRQGMFSTVAAQTTPLRSRWRRDSFETRTAIACGVSSPWRWRKVKTIPARTRAGLKFRTACATAPQSTPRTFRRSKSCETVSRACNVSRTVTTGGPATTTAGAVGRPPKRPACRRAMKPSPAARATSAAASFFNPSVSG